MLASLVLHAEHGMSAAWQAVKRCKCTLMHVGAAPVGGSIVRATTCIRGYGQGGECLGTLARPRRFMGMTQQTRFSNRCFTLCVRQRVHRTDVKHPVELRTSCHFSGCVCKDVVVNVSELYSQVCVLPLAKQE